MASTEITPEELQKALLKYTLLGALAFIGAVVVYVFLKVLN